MDPRTYELEVPLDIRTGYIPERNSAREYQNSHSILIFGFPCFRVYEIQ